MTSTPTIMLLSPDKCLQHRIQQLFSDAVSRCDWQVLAGAGDVSMETLLAELVPDVLMIDMSATASAWYDSYRRRYPERHTPMLVLTEGDGVPDWCDVETGLVFAVSKSALTAGLLNQLVQLLLQTAQLKRERHTQMHQLLQQANTDQLTRLRSRSAFELAVRRGIDALRRQQDRAMLAVMMLDLDDFKSINAAVGYALGDELLKRAAARIESVLPPLTVLARSGGDEFAILQQGVDDPKRAGELAMQLSQCFERPFRIGAKEVSVAVSIGVACYPVSGENSMELISHADVAMFNAKKTRGNSWQFYSDAISKIFYSDMRLEGAMHLALERDEFFLLYQPQYDLQSETIVGAEVLLRWHRPEVGVVSPIDFIPLAEASGMIHALGFWLIEHAFQAIQQLRELGGICKLGINVSAKQLDSATFCQQVKGLMQQYSIGVDQFSFELTESALMLSDQVEANLLQLADMGVQFAVDDFGTGYSALSYLRRLPIDTIKIDRSFILDLVANNDDQTLVRSLIALAENLGLHVVAEGVETAEQLALLKQYNCDTVQGFYYSRPLLLRDLSALISQS